MNILFLGDICGRCGREAVFELLDEVKSEYRVDFTIANGENASAGMGLSENSYNELKCAGIDFFTLGNHAFDKKEVKDLINIGEDIICPANLVGENSGNGLCVLNANRQKIAIINLLGTVYMKPEAINPFECAIKLVEKARKSTNTIIVDIHAEATSEKQALGFYLDGKVSAVIGTHTHVLTADERILPKGSGYITDAGMCGAYLSVLGMDREKSIERFLTGKKNKYVSASGDYALNGVVITTDNFGKCTEINRVCKFKKKTV